MDDKIKAHCPACGDGRWADVRGAFSQKKDLPHSTWSSTTHRILECRACETVFHQATATYSENFVTAYDDERGEHTVQVEDTKYWPSSGKVLRPPWLSKLREIDMELHRLLSDVYAAIGIDLHRLAAVGIRTTFERGATLLSVDPNLTFTEKLIALVEIGHIGNSERACLAAMTDAGNASAHRAWTPTLDQLNTMLVIVCAFVDRNIVSCRDVSALKEAVPARIPKKKGFAGLRESASQT